MEDIKSPLVRALLIALAVVFLSIIIFVRPSEISIKGVSASEARKALQAEYQERDAYWKHKKDRVNRDIEMANWTIGIVVGCALSTAAFFLFRPTKKGRSHTSKRFS